MTDFLLLALKGADAIPTAVAVMLMGGLFWRFRRLQQEVRELQHDKMSRDARAWEEAMRIVGDGKPAANPDTTTAAPELPPAPTTERMPSQSAPRGTPTPVPVVRHVQR